MKKHKVTKRENKKLNVSKGMLIICAIIIGLNVSSLIGRRNLQKQREQMREEYFINNNIQFAEVTNVNDNFTQILWLNYLSSTTKDEVLTLTIDDCLNNLTPENFAKVNSLVDTKEQYENSIFSDIVNIENLEGYYVDIVDIGKRNVAHGKQINVDESNVVNLNGTIYLEIDELLDILYNDYKGELRPITF